MCLRTQQKRVKTAKADIIVYKHVINNCFSNSIDYGDHKPKRLYTSVNSDYITSYQKTPVEIGKTYKSKLDKPDDHGDIHMDLHSFADLADAKKEARNWREVLVKCVIPKGARYYLGDFEEYSSYASNQLQYIEIIRDYKI